MGFFQIPLHAWFYKFKIPLYIFIQNLKSHIFSCMDKIPFVCKKFLWNINLVEKMYGNLSWRHSFIGQKSAWKRRACNTMFRSTGSHNHEITFTFVTFHGIAPGNSIFFLSVSQFQGIAPCYATLELIDLLRITMTWLTWLTDLT